MKRFLIALLFFCACKKDHVNSDAVTERKLSFLWDTIGPYEFTQSYAVSFTGGNPEAAFTYRVTSTGGSHFDNDSFPIRNGVLDASGNVLINLYDLGEYNDGELTLTLIVDGETLTATAIKQEAKVRNYQDFIAMASITDLTSTKNFVQTNDIVFPDSTFTGAPGYNILTGTYDGQGYKISNLKIAAVKSAGAATMVGLFPVAQQGAVLKNVRLETDLTSTGDGVAYVGGLIGISEGVTMINCSVSGRITNSNNALSRTGGLIGYGKADTIIASAFRGSIYSRGWAGGLFGETVEHCALYASYAYWTGNGENGGGLIGNGDANNSIHNCYANMYGMNFSTSLYSIYLPVEELTVTNTYASMGTANNNVGIVASTQELYNTVAAISVTEWPAAAINPPAQPFTANGKLWWE